MKKIQLHICLVLGIGIGFIFGAEWMGRKATFVGWHQSSGAASIQANLVVVTLRSIRTGDTNKAIERLEEQLDPSVIHLAEFYRECPRPQDANALVRALLRAREYRTEHPRKTESPMIDEAVNRAFALADAAGTNLLSPTERGYDILGEDKQ